MGASSVGVAVLNGATGDEVRVLWEANAGLESLSPVGDLDGDGSRDVMASADGDLGGRIHFINPRTGDRFATLVPPPGDPDDRYLNALALPDLEGDGKPNFALNSSTYLALRAYVYNGLDPEPITGDVWVVR